MNNPEVLDGLVGLILAVSIICVILSEWLNDPHVLASSSYCLFSLASLLLSSEHAWGPPVLLSSATSAASGQVIKLSREESSKTIWENSSRVLTDVLLSRKDLFMGLLTLYPRWDCLDSAPFKHSCISRASSYFACTMTLRMGHLDKAWHVFKLMLVAPRPRTHLC